MRKQIEEAVNNLRPFIQRDGGDVEFVEYDEKEKVVYIQMLGSCRGCPSSYITLKSGIEHALQSKFPDDVREVEQVFLE